MFFIVFGVFAINTACTSDVETSEIEKPSPTPSTADSSTSSSTPDTTTNSAPLFAIPSEGESFEAVVQLCELASNSLQCEQECFANNSNLEECVAEAEEIANIAKPETTITTGSTTSTPSPSENIDRSNSDTKETVSAFLGSYTFSDDQFGTKVTVDANESVRSIISNALPNHATGTFPNSGNPNTISEQNTNYEFPTEPVFTGASIEVLTTGVAINGVKFEPGTAESVRCDSGEFYRIEALQKTYNLGLDLNNAHVQPTGEYHYHGVSQLLVDAFSTETDLIHLGFAADGYLIYYSKSGAYESGYELKKTPREGTGCSATGPAGGDRVAIQGTLPDGTYTSDWIHINTDGKLDSCNGVTVNGEYLYLMTDTFPYIPRCLNGQFNASTKPAGPPLGPPPGSGQPPDLTSVADALGIDLNDLISALGPPPPDLEAAAIKLNVPLSELQSLMPRPG